MKFRESDNNEYPRYCQNCGYDLRGSPEPCDCPECGKRCDAGVYVFRHVRYCEAFAWDVDARRAKVRAAFLRITPACVLAAVVACVQEGNVALHFLIYIIAFPLATEVAARLLRAFRESAYILDWVAVDNKGLRFCIGGEKYRMPWSAIRRVHYRGNDAPCCVEFNHKPATAFMQHASTESEILGWAIGLDRFETPKAKHTFVRLCDRVVPVEYESKPPRRRKRKKHQQKTRR